MFLTLPYPVGNQNPFYRGKLALFFFPFFEHRSVAPRPVNGIDWDWAWVFQFRSKTWASLLSNFGPKLNGPKSSLIPCMAGPGWVWTIC